MVYKVLSSSGIEKYLTKMTAWVSQQNQRRKANETSKNEKIKHCAPGDKKLKIFQKRKKAGFLQEEKREPKRTRFDPPYQPHSQGGKGVCGPAHLVHEHSHKSATGLASLDGCGSCPFVPPTLETSHPSHRYQLCSPAGRDLISSTLQCATTELKVDI